MGVGVRLSFKADVGSVCGCHSGPYKWAQRLFHQTIVKYIYIIRLWLIMSSSWNSWKKNLKLCTFMLTNLNLTTVKHTLSTSATWEIATWEIEILLAATDVRGTQKSRQHQCLHLSHWAQFTKVTLDHSLSPSGECFLHMQH